MGRRPLYLFLYLSHTASLTYYFRSGCLEADTEAGIFVPVSFFWIFVYLFVFCFLGPHLQHMEVPRLGVQSELLLPASTTATATPDLSCICDLHHSSWQHRILNPLSRGQGSNLHLMVSGRIRFCCAMKGAPGYVKFAIRASASWSHARKISSPGFSLPQTPHRKSRMMMAVPPPPPPA